MGDQPSETIPTQASPAQAQGITAGKVLVTGGSGFVGRRVIRELVARGYEPVCLIRNPGSLQALLLPEELTRTTLVRGDLNDPEALRQAARGCVAVVHLVGIIMERRLRGQTFERVHVEGTRRVVETALEAGIRRYLHMSAMGTRPNAVSRYHQTKWAAEQIVRGASLDWTIFRPSLIHGPDGEFMQMMKFFATSKVRQPVMPYFGRGEAHLQPVDVRDVAACFGKALRQPETVGLVIDLVGPERFTWKELYDVCALIFTGRRRLKVAVPVALARLLARLMPLAPSVLVPFKFDLGQVQMSQEDSISEAEPVARLFGIKFRDFRQELQLYRDQI